MLDVTSNKKMKFSIKDVIYMLTIVLAFAGNYYTASFERESMKKDIDINETRTLENSNIVKDMNLIKYRLKMIEQMLNRLLEND